MSQIGLVKKAEADWEGKEIERGEGKALSEDKLVQWRNRNLLR